MDLYPFKAVIYIYFTVLISYWRYVVETAYIDLGRYVDIHYMLINMLKSNSFDTNITDYQVLNKIVEFFIQNKIKIIHLSVDVTSSNKFVNLRNLVP